MLAPSLMVQSVKHGGEVWLGYEASGYTAFAVRKLVLNLQAPAHRMVPPLTFRVALPSQPDPEIPSQANPDAPQPNLFYYVCLHKAPPPHCICMSGFPACVPAACTSSA